MKVLALIPTLACGGAERVLANLANDWAERLGWQVRIVLLDTPGSQFFQLAAGVECMGLALSAESSHPFAAIGANCKRIVAIRRALADFQPQVAVAFMSQCNVLLSIASVGTGIPCIGTEHSHPPRIKLGWSWEALRRWSYGGMYAVTALTHESKAWILKETRAKRCAFIPNGVVYPLPSNPPTLDPSSVGGVGKHRLLAVGRLSPEKGFDLLLAAFAPLTHLHSSWDLVIVGEGEQRAALTADIAQRGMSHCVFLPGRAGNIGDWYASAQLFVLSSRYEGFGNVLVEALAYGVPCVSFDCEFGPKEIIQQGVDGILVPPGDSEALASALGAIMTNAPLRKQMSDAARLRDPGHANAKIHTQWEQLLLAAVDNHKPAKQ